MINFSYLKNTTKEHCLGAKSPKIIYLTLAIFCIILMVGDLWDIVNVSRSKTFLDFPLGYDGCANCYKTKITKIFCCIFSFITIAISLLLTNTPKIRCVFKCLLLVLAILISVFASNYFITLINLTS